MMKFNQIVRASVLSLTLASGLVFAGQASAYDAQDLADAEAVMYAAQGVYDDSYQDLQDLKAHKKELEDSYAAAQSWCAYLGSHGHDASMCYLDAWQDFVPDIQTAEMDISYYEGTVLPQDYATLQNAQYWVTYVDLHQNGIPGVP